MNHLFTGDLHGFHLLGFSGNKASPPALKLLNLIKMFVCDKNYNLINTYFYAINIIFVEVFRKKMEMHYAFKGEFHTNQ